MSNDALRNERTLSSLALLKNGWFGHFEQLDGRRCQTAHTEGGRRTKDTYACLAIEQFSFKMDIARRWTVGMLRMEYIICMRRPRRPRRWRLLPPVTSNLTLPCVCIDRCFGRRYWLAGTVITFEFCSLDLRSFTLLAKHGAME